jgi:sortase A
MSRLKKHAQKLQQHRTINNLLTSVVIFLATYIIVAPLLPQASWLITQQAPFGSATKVEAAVLAEANGIIGNNRLFIPSLGLAEVIFEGEAEALSKGVVRRQNTSTPDVGSNTVLIGHRFLYGNKGIFYHLDKLAIGDTIIVHWEINSFTYEVVDSLVVAADVVEIEAPTDDALLTIYTCTPLWTAKDRLVIKARLVEKS